uniref:CG11233 n=1 Tax=Macrostomum lignano TaxID=282301 RepID=A0A1I8JQ22_9PLAT
RQQEKSGIFNIAYSNQEQNNSNEFFQPQSRNIRSKYTAPVSKTNYPEDRCTCVMAASARQLPLWWGIRIRGQKPGQRLDSTDSAVEPESTATSNGESPQAANMVACLIDNCDELFLLPEADNASNNPVTGPRLRSHESVRGQQFAGIPPRRLMTQPVRRLASRLVGPKAKSSQAKQQKQQQKQQQKSVLVFNNKKMQRRSASDEDAVAPASPKAAEIAEARTPRKPWTWLGLQKTVATDTTAHSSASSSGRGNCCSPVADEEADYVPKTSVRRAINVTAAVAAVPF